MSDQKKIYVVTTGEYSDYHICGVTTDYDRAKYIQKCYWTSCYTPEIEEYIDGDTGLGDGELRNVYYVALDNHKRWSAKLDSYSIGKYENSCDLTSDWGVQYYNQFGLNRYNLFSAYIQAEDEEHALKIAQDWYAEVMYRKMEDGE